MVNVPSSPQHQKLVGGVGGVSVVTFVRKWRVARGDGLKRQT